MGKVFHILKGGLADVIHDGLHKQMGNVNTIGKGVNKIHALFYVWCVWVVFFSWFVLKFAIEFHTFNLALELVKVWGHACPLALIRSAMTSDGCGQPTAHSSAIFAHASRSALTASEIMR
jgi:hypothetical protein